MGLNNRVTIQRQNAGEDELGQPVQTWSTLADLWADVRNVSGIQAIKAGAQVSTVQASVRVRKRSDLVAGMRVLHGTTVYAVRAVLPDQRDRRYTDLICEVVS